MKINPPLQPGQVLRDLNPSLAFSYELAQRFEKREVPLSLQKTPISFQEVQVGFTKRPAWFPYVSIHTADIDFSIKQLGRGADQGARKLHTEFAVLIRDESSDEQLGRARLTDLQWDLVSLLGEAAGGGETYRYLDIEKIELIGITPDDVEENVAWGYSGQVLALGTVWFQ